MKLNKYAVVFVSCIAAVTVGAMLMFSRDEDAPKERKEVTLARDDIEKDPEPTDAASYYEVRLEENAVILYKVDAGIRTALDSVEIDTDYYPDSDIKELTKGITAYNVEEGYKILENFVN